MPTPDRPSRFGELPMSTSRVPARRSRRKPRRLLDKPSDARCSDVTVIKPDGSVEIIPALTAKQLREVTPDRLTIKPALRAKVLIRDCQTCRYCLTTVGPFEIDHVIPVAHGGATQLWNLVTACAECNRRKGANVWKPKPLSVVVRMAAAARANPGKPKRRRPQRNPDRGVA